MGTTKKKFTITIGEENNQTSVQTKLHLSPSDKFDVLLGSTFLAPIGGITDPWSQEFHYRVDWDLGGHKKASIPVRYSIPHAASIQCQYMTTGMTYTSVDTFMQEPNLALLHSFEDDDVLTAFEFNIISNDLYSEPEYSSDASQEQPYEPNLQE